MYQIIMMKENSLNTEMLITEIECRQMLWQSSHKDLKNKAVTKHGKK